MEWNPRQVARGAERGYVFGALITRPLSTQDSQTRSTGDSPLGGRLRFHHVGVAVQSIPEAVPRYEAMGYEVSGPVFDPGQNVHLAACRMGGGEHAGGHLLELVAPADDSSPCMSYLRKSGPGPYHVCYECSSISETLAAMKAARIRYSIASPAKPTTLFERAQVTFLFALKMGLIELIAFDREVD